MKHLPVAVGLVLCEQVIVAETTRYLTPVNCFSRLKREHFPSVESFFVVAWLTDGLGDLKFEVVVKHLDTDDEVARIERQLQLVDRLTDYRFTARIRDCLFPVAGYYEVLLIADGELVAHRRLVVVE